MAQQFKGYHATIHEATGVTDIEDLEEIEDTMRHIIFHSTLDWQARDQLKQGAVEAWEVIQIMRDPAAMAELEAAR